MAEVKNVFIDPEEPVTIIESFCPGCRGQGITRLLLCTIPFFKDIVVMSFSCEECGYRNNEVQSAGSLAEKGVKITVSVTSSEFLNREVVKSEWATIRIPEIELEIPANTQKASFSTIEGVLEKTYDELSCLQPERRVENPITAQKIDEFLEKLLQLRQGKSFTLELDDPSGNSYIAHDYAKHKLAANDPTLRIEHYARTKEQMVAMGYVADNEEEIKERSKMEERKEEEEIEESKEVKKEEVKSGEVKKEEENSQTKVLDLTKPLEGDALTDEPIEMPTRCFACYKEGTVKMCVTNIPHYKEAILMAFNCDFCGAKSNEIKGGGGVSEKAKKITFTFKTPQDLCRFVIKSDTASVSIPALGLDLTPGTLGSLITTIEGLLEKIHEELLNNIGFTLGDSRDTAENRRFAEFMEQLVNMKSGNASDFQIIIDDPLSSSYIAGIGENDSQVIVEEYQRTVEQDEELGISQMAEN